MRTGFILLETDEMILQGQRCCSRLQTPIQAEAEGLSWVMKEVWDRGSNNSCLNLTASN